jgi:hypothetical protein
MRTVNNDVFSDYTQQIGQKLSNLPQRIQHTNTNDLTWQASIVVGNKNQTGAGGSSKAFAYLGFPRLPTASLTTDI